MQANVILKTFFLACISVLILNTVSRPRSKNMSSKGLYKLSTYSQSKVINFMQVVHIQ